MISLPNTTGTGIVMGSGSNYLATSFTLAAWVHRVGAGTTISTGTGGQLAIEPILTGGMAQADTTGLNCAFFLGYIPASSKFGGDFEDMANGLNHPHTFTNTTTTWPAHVCITYNNSSSLNTGSWTSYVNGVQDGISFVTTNSLQVRTPDTTSLQGVGIGIGVTSAAAKSGAWNGFVSEVCIWNTVLDATEVAALAKSKIIGTPLQIRPAALQGYWQLNEAGHNVGLPLTAKFIQDRSGKNNHGTAFGKVSGSAEYILSYQ